MLYNGIWGEGRKGKKSMSTIPDNVFIFKAVSNVSRKIKRQAKNKLLRSVSRERPMLPIYKRRSSTAQRRQEHIKLLLNVFILYIGLYV